MGRQISECAPWKGSNRLRARYFYAILTTAAVLFSVASALALSQGPSQVPILLYHHLAQKPEAGNGAVIAIREFQSQMEWLRSNGYRAITTEQLGAWLSGKGRLPARPVLITFDDGYRSNYEHGYPVLKRLRLKATLFLVTSKVGRQPGKYPYVTWSQLREMTKNGVFEVQAHTHDGHHEIDDRPALLTWTAAEIQADLRLLQRELAEHNLPAATALAYPFGAHDAEVDGAIAADGIPLGFSGEPGYVRKGDNPYALKRLTIYPGMSACRFRETMLGRPQDCEEE